MVITDQKCQNQDCFLGWSPKKLFYIYHYWQGTEPKEDMEKGRPQAGCQTNNLFWIKSLSTLRIKNFVIHYPTVSPLSTPSAQLPCQFGLCFTLFPFSVWQEIVFQARQTWEQQSNTLSQTRLLCHKYTSRQKLLINIWINPFAC